MMTGRYRFADKIVEVHSLFEQVHLYCKDYQTDGPYDFAVEITEDDIGYERARAEQGNNSDAYLEELAVYRKISEKMPEFDTILFHGSAIAVDGTFRYRQINAYSTLEEAPWRQSCHGQR